MTGSADLSTLLAGESVEVAPRLLGGLLTHGPVTLRITEVEAYAGASDPASHAYRGPTPRTAVMFGPPGHLYCYLSYGMHVCANVVVGPEGTASAVLIRAGEIIDGEEIARVRRSGASSRDLARGPGRLCQALGLTLEHNATDLRREPVSLRLPPRPVAKSSRGPRVGVSKAADLPWRFWCTDDPTVSGYQRSPRAASEPL